MTEAFLISFGPLFLWLAFLAWAVCKAARKGDAQLEDSYQERRTRYHRQMACNVAGPRARRLDLQTLPHRRGDR